MNQAAHLSIGDASETSGLPIKTIRYYEDIGLITPARFANGYRAFSQDDLHRLHFLARARSLGFSIDECRDLLELYRDKDRASADVKRIAEAHLDEIERKIAELQSMRSTLSHLVEHCHGDQRPECPILEELADLETRTR